ncbi:RNA polymerase sigma-70 factor [Chitinophaga sp. CF418]|uniref:RNA polymerase sigma-70 factor n=1 Tax=Chitinophaga sp. CF418 TaxID=1855287 RepID=UPI00091601B5|nr:RNA polymerase sigma-70 factor [Chitinophaga sp. CF418]SHN40726.1 RNA polymerase sigma-70 factor, ECF subfamily [Chitinophaga sp. CF418]
MSINYTQHNLEDVPPDNLWFDKAAFKELFKKDYPALCIYCRLKYGFDIHLAEEVVHSSFIKLWETRQTLVPGISPISYLYKIVDNRSLNTLRHEKVKQQHAAHLLKTSSEDISETTFNSIDLKELSSAIDVAIAELPEQMRIIFELRKFEGLKYAEIARRLNISVKTVDTQISRAMIKLKEKLARFLILFIILIFNFLLKK